MNKFLLILILSLGIWQQLPGQPLFGNRCLGVWEGTMFIYSHGELKDSVAVRLTVAQTADPHAWTWKTEYLSEKLPMVKDYTLRLKDQTKNLYVTDEGEGLELQDHLFGDKLYCVFETEGILLTSTYELIGDRLIFEVTAGKILPGSVQQVTNYSVNTLQRVVFKKTE